MRFSYKLDLPHPNAPSIMVDDVHSLVKESDTSNVDEFEDEHPIMKTTLASLLGMHCLKDYVNTFRPLLPSDMPYETW